MIIFNLISQFDTSRGHQSLLLTIFTDDHEMLSLETPGIIMMIRGPEPPLVTATGHRHQNITLAHTDVNSQTYLPKFSN